MHSLIPPSIYAHKVDMLFVDTHAFISTLTMKHHGPNPQRAPQDVEGQTEQLP